jgi:phosphatidylglycerol lysyltransferase
VSPDRDEDLTGDGKYLRKLAPLARIGRWVGPLLGLVLIGGAVFVLQHQLDEYSYSDVIGTLSSTPVSAIFLALLLSAGAYGALVGYDALALAYVGHSLPLRRIALGSFVAYSMSHSLGFHMITSGSIRYRFWSSWGVPNASIARALALASTSFLLGMLLVCGAVLLFAPPENMALLRLSTPPLRVLGAILVLGVLAFLLWMRFARAPLRVLGAEVAVPRVRFTLGHLCIAASDWLMAASVAFVLLPSGHGVGLPQFVGVFLFALLVGAIGHVPGGVGVFEALVVLMLEPYLAPPQVLGSLILYRLIYYVLPFVIGLSLMVAHEARIATASGRGARWIPATIPTATGVAVFAAGTIVLLSTAVAMNAGRMSTVDVVLPLALVEVSHLASALAGAALLFLGWFLRRQLRRAWLLAVYTLVIGAIAALARGMVWEVSIVLLATLGALLLSRSLFAAPGELAPQQLPSPWLVGIFIVLLLTVSLGAHCISSSNTG